MGNGEKDKHIHAEMVHRAHCLSVTEKRDHPAEPSHPARVPAPGLRIKRETRQNHHDASQNKHGKHRELRKRIVPGVFRRRFSQEQIVEHLRENPFPPLH